MNNIETLIDRLTDRQRHAFAVTCARRVQHLMTDSRSVAALDTRERWLRGEATDEEMTAARAAARAAARDAAWDAARAAAWDAVWDAARDAARAAARAAALAAAWDAVWDAARDAARAAAWDAAAARNAAFDSERAWQRSELERMLGAGGGA